MSALPNRKYISPEDYLTTERKSREKHEYFDGEIFQMAGSSKEHNLITSNLIISLGSQLKKRNCQVYPPDMRVHIPKTGLFTYPDISVICGEPEFLPHENLDTLINPTLIVEILSPSTEGYDKGAKFDNYRNLESLHEYLLISQNSKKIILYSRQKNGSWILRDFIGEKTEIELLSIECKLTMDDIYDKVGLKQ